MRSLKLTSAVLAAAGSLVLTPAAALAGHGFKSLHLAGNSKCRIRLAVSPTQVTFGDSVLLTGALVCAGGADGEKTVTILERSAGGGGFHVVGTPMTNKEGVFTFTPTPLQTDSTFQATAEGAHPSIRRTVRVAPIVSITKAPTEGSTLYTGPAHKVEFQGSVNPIDNGAEVVLQRESNAVSEEWFPIQGKNFVNAEGKFKIVHRFGVPGDANLRVVVRPHGLFDIRGVSDALSYVVSQTQNPKLTFESASGDPIAFGKPLTLKGVVAGATSGEKVKIEAHSFGSTGYSVVGEPTTTAGGAYELTIPIAEKNALYFAATTSVHSAVLYEGVHWTVVTSTIPTTASAGTLIMFTGTATPTTRVGHAVYLERHNLVGSGWHVVNIGFTGPGGTFSIPWLLVGSGKEAFRVKVPGDPINEAGASSPQEVEVTPALVKPLAPVAPPSLPH